MHFSDLCLYTNTVCYLQHFCATSILMRYHAITIYVYICIYACNIWRTIEVCFVDNVIDFPRFVPSKQRCSIFRLERFLQDQAGAGLGWTCRCGVDLLDSYGRLHFRNWIMYMYYLTYILYISVYTIYIYSWPCMVLLSNDPLQCEFHPKLGIWYLCDHQLGSVVHHRTPGVQPIHLQLTQNHTLWKRSPWKAVYLPLNLRPCTGKCD